MKKYVYLLAAFLAFGASFAAKAAPGDTTWVQANISQLSWYGNYDTSITFPSGSTTYRRIYMIFTLGKYMCPSGSTYCGDWDYTLENFLMTPGGDTLELGRLISPYANAGAPRTPWSWQQHYVFDVTDYAAKLQGAATMRILYSGYSGGFTGNIKFAFIEGTPDRNVMGVDRLWHGSFAYGDTTHSDSNNINVHFAAVSKTVPAGTQTTSLKYTVTGHGSDANNCCEFMSHNYQVMLNGSPVATQTIWRSDCGMNELYPQSGTWLLERANWCPGALVYPNFHTLPGITAGSSFNTAIQFDPYIGSGSLGSYITEAHLIYYGPVNKTTDAMLSDIVSPTTDENHFRENPINSAPVIKVKNTGTATITSLEIACNVDAGDTFYYNWTGSIASLDETTITLPEVWAVRSASGTSGNHVFYVKVAQVNGAAGDDDPTNDGMRSSFIGAPVWPVKFKIMMRTNNETNGGSTCETEWRIYDAYNNVVASRTGGAINTLYNDTVTLGPAPYRLEITDGSCDGLNWWANSGSGISSGYLYVRQLTGANIAMNGYNYTGTYNNDFGCGFTQYFVTNWPTGVQQVNNSGVSINAYPNPAQSKVNIDLEGLTSVNGKLQIMDMLGRVVSETACFTAHQEINTAAFADGVYSVIFTDNQDHGKVQARLVIAK